jgi:hypothetical protein
MANFFMEQAGEKNNPGSRSKAIEKNGFFIRSFSRRYYTPFSAGCKAMAVEKVKWPAAVPRKLLG